MQSFTVHAGFLKLVLSTSEKGFSLREGIWLPEPSPEPVCLFWGTLGDTYCPSCTIIRPLETVQLGKKISSNREQKTVMLVILHYTRGGDPFITIIHTNHNTKNICNIWWDLSTTHVIKTACHFNVVNCVVNVTLAHYIKKNFFCS